MHIEVSHSKFQEGRNRSTVVTAWMDENTVIQAVAQCAEHDNFCKRTGRKIAAQRLLNKLKAVGYGRDVRREAFLTACPEYQNEVK